MIPAGLILENSKNLFYIKVDESLSIIYQNNFFKDYVSHISPEKISDFIKEDYDLEAMKTSFDKSEGSALTAVDFQCRIAQKTGAKRWTWWEVQFYDGVFHLVGGDLLDVISIENYKSVKMQRVLEKITWIQSHKVRKPVANILGLSDYLSKTAPEDKEAASVYKMLRDSAKELDEVVSEMTRLCDEIRDN